MNERASFEKPFGSSSRRRLSLGGEMLLALGPTVTILAVYFLVQAFSRQRLLFASLASSAFLIYLDPAHPTNSTRTVVLSQMLAAVMGIMAQALFGPNVVAVGVAMVVVIVAMILLDAMHPPAVSTALGFAFKTGPESNFVLFSFAVGLVAVLIVLQRGSVRLIAYESRPRSARRMGKGAP